MSELEQWDITSSVGLTALGVAAARSIETHRKGRLISDPFAEKFVEAADAPAPLPTRPEQANAENGQETWGLMADYMAMRSRFFDDYFDEASADGIDQVVLLAAGLDTRAYRLHWATPCAVYEVDQDKVLTFKQEVLDQLGAQPHCARHLVPTDLREDWDNALRAAGFDPARPTAWLAEGLLPYLPGQAEEDLFDRINALSAPGSRLAIEYTPNMHEMHDNELFEDATSNFGVDIRTLWSDESRRDSADWLNSAGWSVHLEKPAELSERYQRPLPAELPDAVHDAGLAVARKPTA